MYRPAALAMAVAILCTAHAPSARAGGIVDNSNPYVKMQVLSEDSFVLNTPGQQISGFSVRLTNAQGHPQPGLTVSIFTNYYFCFDLDPTCTDPSPDLFGAFPGLGSGQELVTDADGIVTSAAYKGGTVPGSYAVHAGVYSLIGDKNNNALGGLPGPAADFDIQQVFEVAGFPGGYLSGNWYAPTLGGGTGFELEFTDAIDGTTGHPIAIAMWFAYTPDGSGQSWLYAQGPYDPAVKVVSLPAILPSGAKFLPNFISADVHNVPWGTLTFTFSDCNNGTVAWDSYIPGYGYSFEPLLIQRLTRIAGTSCPQ